jgi:aldehyde:ferredoxin oxidoreductase
MYGWKGVILRINLTNKNITKERLTEEAAHSYIGGRGINIKYLFDELKPGIDPLGPENKVIFSAGPATGTISLASQRWTVSSKSPLSGFVGDGNCGSAFGLRLKQAGYDVLIIEGTSDKPVYIWIDEDNVEIKDASHLWGRTTIDTERIIKKQGRDPDIRVASIGPGGENLVKFASVESDRRAAARTGVGAVMGSKKLKAVAAVGSKGPKVADPKGLEDLMKMLRTSPAFSDEALVGMREVGPGLDNMVLYNDLGIMGVFNYQEPNFDKWEQVGPKEIAKHYLKKIRSCDSCPMACNHTWVLTEGKYEGLFGEDLMAPVGQFTGCIGNSDPDFVFWAADFCDAYGIDVMDVAGVTAFAMECYQRGIVSAKDLDGLELSWGNTDAVAKLMRKITYREGIGNLFAEGLVPLSKAIGNGSEKYAMQVKNTAIDARDPRGSAAWGLGYAVGSRGADHARSIYIEMPAYGTPPELIEEILKQQVDGFTGFHRMQEKDTGRPYKWFEDVRAFDSCLPICVFCAMRYPNWLEVDSSIYKTVTGVSISSQEALAIGERINNYERAFNIREGLTRKDDTLPERFTRETLKKGKSKDHVIDIDFIVDEYYDARGWDRRTGFPKRQKLEQLGMKKVADELERMGRLSA